MIARTGARLDDEHGFGDWAGEVVRCSSSLLWGTPAGRGFEYVDPGFTAAHNAAHNAARGYVQHPRFGVRPGSYTDDTQMTIAIAELLVFGAPWTADTLADAFVRVFRRDPREGHARGFHQLLTELGDGAEFPRRIRPDSDKSGAATRAGPWACCPRCPMWCTTPGSRPSSPTTPRRGSRQHRRPRSPCITATATLAR